MDQSLIFKCTPVTALNCLMLAIDLNPDLISDLLPCWHNFETMAGMGKVSIFVLA